MDLVIYPMVLWLSDFVNIWQDVQVAGVKDTFWEKQNVAMWLKKHYFITKHTDRKAILNCVYNSDAVQYFSF